MNKDDLIKRLLEKLDPEDLEELLKEDEEDVQQLEQEVSRQPSEFHAIKQSRPKKTKKTTKKGKKQKKGRKDDKGEVCRKESMQISNHRHNDFDDMMKTVVLSADEKKEFENAEKIKTAPIERSKRPSTLVNVTCRCCKEEFEVSAALVAHPKRWKCNTCSTGAF